MPSKREPCKPSCDRKNWRDEPASGGVIRTVCKVCGKWIGNRFVQAGK